jgi:histidinol-phosphate aminotransferase
MILPRDEVRTTPPAEHGGRRSRGREDLLDFSVCLNAFGPAPSVLDAIRSATVDEYPDPRSTNARRVVANAWNVLPDEVAITAGSAEAIQAVCLAYVRPGDRVLIGEPAFGEYRRAALLCGANVVATRGALDDDTLEGLRTAVLREHPRLVFVASPLNPSGLTFARETLARVADACRAVDALLVIDQAYDAFATTPLGSPALRSHDNVLHLRSLTKEHALAGVRVAVAAGHESIIASVEAVRVPWATSAAAQLATIAAFGDDARAHVRESVACLRGERARIANALSTIGVRATPTSTHYMLVACDDATTLRDRLAVDHGILVRDCSSFGLPGHIRVVARRPDENDRLIHALSQTLQ